MLLQDLAISGVWAFSKETLKMGCASLPPRAAGLRFSNISSVGSKGLPERKCIITCNLHAEPEHYSRQANEAV